jgi:hypothetical protein
LPAEAAASEDEPMAWDLTSDEATPADVCLGMAEIAGLGR